MQTIGERLEEARKRKGVSLREAAEATKIRSDYLQKLEANKFDLGLSPIYLRGFLRGYATYLDLPADKLVGDFDDLDPDSPRTARPINREVYGRMEFGTSDAAATPRAEPPAPAAEGAHKPAPRAPRPSAKNFPPIHVGGASTGRGSVLSLGKLVGGVVVLIVVAVWAVTSFFSGPPKVPAPAPSALTAERTILPDAPAIPENTPTLQVFARDTVKVVLQQKGDARVLFNGTLKRGESQTVPRRGAISVSAEPWQNLEFEIDGKRWPMPKQNSAEITAPAPR
jgi:transcriptional regulator with XRE-family HTH domain